ncbi:flavodoxin family protein [Chloroflexota bacterium]
MEKILGISGSPRKGGNSDILLQNLLAGARDGGVATEEIHLCDYQIQPCIGCERCKKDKRCTGLKDGMQLLYPKIWESKGLILVTPVYFYNVTAQMKAFIDRLYCYFIYGDERPGPWSCQLTNQGRKAIIAAIGEQLTDEEGGMDLTMDAMRRSVGCCDYEIIKELPIYGIFHKGKVRRYARFLEQAAVLGRELASNL